MTGTKKIAMFGSAAALAFAVGFDGVGVNSLGNTPTTNAPSAPSVAPAPAHPASGVHYANLTGCIPGLDCCASPRVGHRIRVMVRIELDVGDPLRPVTPRSRSPNSTAKGTFDAEAQVWIFHRAVSPRRD